MLAHNLLLISYKFKRSESVNGTVGGGHDEVSVLSAGQNVALELLDFLWPWNKSPLA